jgi:hypothetical protein
MSHRKSKEKKGLARTQVQWGAFFHVICLRVSQEEEVLIMYLEQKPIYLQLTASSKSKLEISTGKNCDVRGRVMI